MKTKKIAIASAIIVGMIVGVFLTTFVSAAPSLAKKLAGRFLFQVEGRGELWYVDPVTLTRSQIRNPQKCFDLVKQKMTGINNTDLSSIPTSTSPLIKIKTEKEKTYYDGHITVSGKYFRSDIGGNLCFSVNSTTDYLIPRESTDKRVAWFCFQNESSAKSLLGIAKEPYYTKYIPVPYDLGFGLATIVVSNYVVNNMATEASDTARLEKIISNAKNPVVKIYFASNKENPDCLKTEEFLRVIPATKKIATATLYELLKGPNMNDGEIATSTIPSGTQLISLNITDQTAYADFSKELQNYGGGSCSVAAIRAQIEKTLKQFSTVQNVVISVEGKAEGILQP